LSANFQSPEISSQPGLEGAKSDWTVAVYLGAYTDADGRRGNLGAEDKLSQLEELRDKTKDGHVTIVIEAIVRQGEEPLHSGNPPKGDIAGPYQAVLIRMKDGKEQVISKKPSGQIKENLKEFADYAESQLSKHIAYVIEAHGAGSIGMSGGLPSDSEHLASNGGTNKGPTDGTILLSEFTSVMSDAMKKRGRQKADLIDLDDCYGGQWGVIKSMSQVSDQLVASEIRENGALASDGSSVNSQNLNAWISELDNNPNQNGYALANLIVEQAKQGKNDGAIEATPTLAHYDLAGYEKEFEAKLDRFGNALCTAMIIDKNDQSIFSLVNNLTNLAAQEKANDPSVQAQNYRADLGAFAQSVLMKINSGEIIDGSHDLRQAAEELNRYLADRRKLIADLYIASKDLSADDAAIRQSTSLTGLSVFLVDDKARNNPAVRQDYLDELVTIEAGRDSRGWVKFLRSLETGERPSLF
jgi:hypothetical protein